MVYTEYDIAFGYEHSFFGSHGVIQQSASDGNSDPQLFVPHSRFPTHSPSISQSPSATPHGLPTEQHSPS